MEPWRRGDQLVNTPTYLEGEYKVPYSQPTSRNGRLEVPLLDSICPLGILHSQKDGIAGGHQAYRDEKVGQTSDNPQFDAACVHEGVNV